MSEESWQKSMDSPLVQKIIDLHAKGNTVTEIADKTNRFKHTIHSVYFWLNLKPNKRGTKKKHLKLVDNT
jgi:DNA invertase Pin-like site-specific DNA recombinase